MEIFKEFIFEAAHYLPAVAENHKCHRLHGHSYRVQLFICGAMDETKGWIMDFGEVKKIFQPIYEQLDHHYLNKIEGLKNPTAENICRWIWSKLKPNLPNLSKIVLYETSTAGAVYEGEEK